MITEARVAEMDVAALMSIRKPSDHSRENRNRVPTNGYSVFRYYPTFMLKMQENIVTVRTVDGSDAHLPPLPAVAYFGSENSETTLAAATRSLCHALLPLTSAQATAYTRGLKSLSS